MERAVKSSRDLKVFFCPRLAVYNIQINARNRGAHNAGQPRRGGRGSGNARAIEHTRPLCCINFRLPAFRCLIETALSAGTIEWNQSIERNSVFPSRIERAFKEWPPSCAVTSAANLRAEIRTAPCMPLTNPVSRDSFCLHVLHPRVLEIDEIRGEAMLR